VWNIFKGRSTARQKMQRAISYNEPSVQNYLLDLQNVEEKIENFRRAFGPGIVNENLLLFNPSNFDFSRNIDDIDDYRMSRSRYWNDHLDKELRALKDLQRARTEILTLVEKYASRNHEVGDEYFEDWANPQGQRWTTTTNRVDIENRQRIVHGTKYAEYMEGSEFSSQNELEMVKDCLLKHRNEEIKRIDQHREAIRAYQNAEMGRLQRNKEETEAAEQAASRAKREAAKRASQEKLDAQRAHEHALAEEAATKAAAEARQTEVAAELERERLRLQREADIEMANQKTQATQQNEFSEARHKEAIVKAEADAQREHERRLALIELEKLKEQRLAAEAARDAAALAKAQNNEQFAAILKSLKDDES